MSQHAKQKVSLVSQLSPKERDRFGYRLIDRLVEADHVVYVCGVGLTRLCPQLQYAGTQRTVLGSHLADIKSVLLPQEGMSLCRCPGSICKSDCVPLCLPGLLGGCLGTHYVLNHSTQNLLAVVAKRSSIHPRCGGQ